MMIIIIVMTTSDILAANSISGTVRNQCFCRLSLTATNTFYRALPLEMTGSMDVQVLRELRTDTNI
jgi:hypothetical protein